MEQKNNFYLIEIFINNESKDINNNNMKNNNFNQNEKN